MDNSPDSIELKIKNCSYASQRKYYERSLLMKKKSENCDASIAPVFTEAAVNYYVSAELRSDGSKEYIHSTRGQLLEKSASYLLQIIEFDVDIDGIPHCHEYLDPVEKNTKSSVLLHIAKLCQSSTLDITGLTRTKQVVLCLESALATLLQHDQASDNLRLAGILSADFCVKLRAAFYLINDRVDQADALWSLWGGDCCSKAYEMSILALQVQPVNEAAVEKYLAAAEAFVLDNSRLGSQLIEDGNALIRAHHEKPSLIIFGGPNGSGKSTLTRVARSGAASDPMITTLGHSLLGCKYTNADEITVNLSKVITMGGDLTPSEQHKIQDKINIHAANIAEDIRKHCLETGRSFAFETVLSMGDKIDLLRRASEQGFHTQLVFVGTSDPAINIDRIDTRRCEGGHDVPEQKVIERYHRAMKWIVVGCSVADITYLYDNSVEGGYPKCWASVKKGGEVVECGMSEAPEWIVKVLEQLKTFMDGGNDLNTLGLV